MQNRLKLALVNTIKFTMPSSILLLPIISVTGIAEFKDRKDKKDTWISQQIDQITKGSTVKEMAIGGIAGWCSGIVFSKIGKTAASALAGGLLMFQIAQHQGYIKVNWSKVNKDVKKAQKTFDKHSDKEVQWFAEQTKSFIEDYKFLVTGFAGGFLIGIAM